MLATSDQQLKTALHMNPDELPTTTGRENYQPEASATFDLAKPIFEETSDRSTSEPLGIQEASAQALIEEEKPPLVERLEVEQAQSSSASAPSTVTEMEQRVADLQRREQALRREIATLQASQARLQEETAASQAALGRLVQEGLKELEQRKQTLQVSVEQLERRQERVRDEMRTTFAGVSQDLAIRVQSFKDYLVGSLQDLALAAEQLELPQPGAAVKAVDRVAVKELSSQQTTAPQLGEQGFQEQTKKIRNLLDQYRNRPDYYGSAWQLRRTFEPVHADRVSNWFFTQGGRGAVRTMGSRLQNILIASATVSILYTLYGDRLRTLVLAQSPERLGEWRRGLQDCLGITRSEFGPERGVGLFEDPVPLAQKADRLVKDGLLPLIIIDETEDEISLALLQFPLWLAFAPNPQVPTYSY